MPVLVTSNVYSIVSPGETNPSASASISSSPDFSSSSSGSGTGVGTIAVSGGDATSPVGDVPVAIAVFVIEPVFMSSCVTAYGADSEDLQLAGLERDRSGRDTRDRDHRSTVTPVSVTLPVLVTVNE